MSVPNPEVEAGGKTDGIIGFNKRRVSLKQSLAGVRTAVPVGGKSRMSTDSIVGIKEQSGEY